MGVMAIPIVVGALGTAPEGLELLKIGGRIQTTIV